MYSSYLISKTSVLLKIYYVFGLFNEGVRRDEVQITGDLLTSLFRASTRGATPRTNTLLDALYDLIAFVSFFLFPYLDECFLKKNLTPQLLFFSFFTPGLVWSGTLDTRKVGVPIWRRATDGMVLAYTEQHHAYLKEKKLL